MTIHSVRLSEEIDQEVVKLMAPGVTRSDIIRAALLQYIKREKFRVIRQQILPHAEAKGFYTDEDVFEAIS